MKKKKERAVRYFGIFMLFMLICTIVSRGIYASRMPRIQTGTVERKTLTRKITADGAVLTKEEVPVVTEAGLLVEKVAVVEGQKVEPGELLFQVDLPDLEKMIQQADLQIKAEEAKIAELNASGSTAVNRASQDLKDAMDQATGEVDQANAGYQAARNERDAFPSLENYKKKAYKKDAEYQKLLKNSKKKKATKEEKKAFSDYKKSLDASLAESYEQEKQALDAAVSEKEQAVNAANTSKNDSIKQAERALEDAKKGNGEAGSRLEQQNQIQLLKENRERLQSIKQEEGKIFSRISGYVGRILVHSGERTSDTSALVLSDASGEKLFQAVLPKEERGYLALGDKMSLSFSNGTKQFGGVEIGAVGELEDGSCQVTAKIEKPDVTIGETGTMELTKEIGSYSCCIPLSALHTVDNSDFVYLVEEQTTILGTELTARKRKVKVLERDEEYAALEDGALADDDVFVSDADKEIGDGTRVRMAE